LDIEVRNNGDSAPAALASAIVRLQHAGSKQADGGLISPPDPVRQPSVNPVEVIVGNGGNAGGASDNAPEAQVREVWASGGDTAWKEADRSLRERINAILYRGWGLDPAKTVVLLRTEQDGNSSPSGAVEH
jgi:hypothetical protein